MLAAAAREDLARELAWRTGPVRTGASAMPLGNHRVEPRHEEHAYGLLS
jgi:hypothetical protein